MYVKRYSDDWAKARARDMLKDMIERTLLTFRKSQQLSVLCFPGIDAEEILQVYDKIGVPRKNIVGIEREKDIANALEKKDLGIKLNNCTLEEYLKEQKRCVFDVVSLDYIGPISVKQMRLLKDITYKQRRNHFVLHCANLIRRDKNSVPLYYLGYALDHQVDCHDLTLDDVVPSAYLDGIVKRSSAFTDKTNGNETIRPEKMSGYSILLKNCFRGGSLDDMDTLFKFAIGDESEEMIRIIEEKVSSVCNRSIEIDRKRPYGQPAIATHLVNNYLEQAIWGSIQIECDNYGILHKDTQFVIWQALFDHARQRKMFRAKDAALYSYISESGAPMIGNMYFLSHPERMLKRGAEIVKKIGYPNQFYVKDVHEIYDLVNKYAKESRKFQSEEEMHEIDKKEANRVFLGNSSKPVLSKKRAIEEFRKGATVDDIKKQYRGWSKKPLSQWKAHVTMGTYDAKPIEKDDSIEIISKGELLDLISSGIPTQEIYNAYPTSFSMVQLRAYQSHIKRGTYADI